jgi:aryl carrier-like protein
LTSLRQLQGRIQARKDLLIVFLTFQELKSFDDIAFDATFKKVTKVLNSRLSARVPAGMNPTAYIPLVSIPTRPSGKTDRRKFKPIAQRWTFQELAATTSDPTFYARTRPSTDVEICLQSLWAAVLGLKTMDIKAIDNSLRIGGDSISAMRLVAAARKQAYRLPRSFSTQS